MDPIPYKRPLSEIFEFSKRKNLLALNYYAENNTGEIVFSLLVIVALSIFLRTLKRKLSDENELRTGFCRTVSIQISRLFSNLHRAQPVAVPFSGCSIYIQYDILDPVCRLSYDHILEIYHKALEKVLAYDECTFPAGMCQ